MAIPRLRECCTQVEAEEVRNSRNKVHQTWEQPYLDSLYFSEKKFNFLVCGWRVTIWESMSRTLSRIHKGNRNVRMYGRRAKDSDPRLSDSRFPISSDWEGHLKSKLWPTLA